MEGDVLWVWSLPCLYNVVTVCIFPYFKICSIYYSAHQHSMSVTVFLLVIYIYQSQLLSVTFYIPENTFNCKME